MVHNSIPGRAVRPYSAAAASTAGQLRQELWSVTAMTSSPFRAHMPAMLAGVMSSSPQEERQEWMCRS